MLDLVPKRLFLTRGKGVDEDRLTSFEYALRDAGIAGTNLVLISSIFPPHARLVSRKAGLSEIKAGQILFTIYSKNQTNEPHRLCAASVGVAQPKDKNRYGYLSEYDSFGQNEKQAGDYAEDVAAQMLASSLGIKFDIDKSWDEKRQQWTISGQIYKTSNVTQTAKGNRDGKWTTVFAAAVLLL
ncbi:MAG: arginine decarboxylase, pyruvoyl-dependent [Thaumarchaeota archaeon]|nr:arginine decarboxylase, pyruvoyl-dependent [Nitrososphaerota archaeon]RNJ73726.1 MAG: arginine decarboxylase, pyruvoyl-dependent [Thaumarchaeota archaeon S13]RNJ74423.1 MAG: arginine decarboxylase, pyruvoyl-dependent [Thaumarchaeota archaeon S15]MDD9813119.1 arginine decarboxylase, pyruvoyl-dependent [Nitrososphaerota archaeon]MDD9825778.1 arginine decarboxylase, pyruvoyl-dependent [Nitrososphaerota archaeon]